MDDIGVFILTFNEEKHIGRSLENILRLTDKVFVVDACSTDRTAAIASRLGAVVVQNPWPGIHALQVNWAVERYPFNTQWIMRLDADEYLSGELIDEIKSTLNSMPADISGILLRRKTYFLGRLMKHSASAEILRIWRAGKAVCEQRLMDEHMILKEGKSIKLENLFYDDNRRPIGWWTEKHNGYSTKEAMSLLGLYGNKENSARKSLYNRLPLFIRPFLFFVYRYFLRLGFLDGKEGFLWHFLQGWWYRTLVDAKIFEIKKACGADKTKIKEYLRQNYAIDV